jgi:hypothetical protein
MKTITFNGATLTLAPIDDDRQEMFSAWVKRQTLHELRALKPFATDAENAELMQVFVGNLSSGAYEWGMPATLAAAISPAGAKHLALLVLGQNAGFDRPEAIEALWNDKEAWEAYCDAIAA